jgi:hypothetical protein
LKRDAAFDQRADAIVVLAGKRQLQIRHDAFRAEQSHHVKALFELDVVVGDELGPMIGFLLHQSAQLLRR